jgi:hypothetical protein
MPVRLPEQVRPANQPMRQVRGPFGRYLVRHRLELIDVPVRPDHLAIEEAGLLAREPDGEVANKFSLRSRQTSVYDTVVAM